MKTISPISGSLVPTDEINRLISLSEFDLDYSSLQDNFNDLTRLAAKIAGTPMSLINLIDSYTLWTIADFGLPVQQFCREESICQYTILEEEYFEIKDLSEDDRFKEQSYVVGEPKVNYYFGIPLKTDKGHHIGSLCVLDKVHSEISVEKIELLKVIAHEIVNRLKMTRIVNKLRSEVSDARTIKLKVAHDIRGPLSGITGLAKIITEQGEKNTIEDVLQLVSMIYKSGNSLLSFAEEILADDKKEENTRKAIGFTLTTFKEQLLKLYSPQAYNKNICFEVIAKPELAETPITKDKLLQITGNLISNSIKFTPQNGKVTVGLDVVSNGVAQPVVSIMVSDSGVGLEEEICQKILRGEASSTNGTCGESGYGFGLALVRHLVYGLKGTMEIYSKKGEGTSFHIQLPK
jgi:signal transduction histidine kinase